MQYRCRLKKTGSLLLAVLASVPAHAVSFQDLWDYRFTRQPDGGLASVYSEPQATSSGEKFRPYAENTCAIYGEPFGRKLRVTNVFTGRSTICRVTDRGPNRKFRPRRVIDLTPIGDRDIGCDGMCAVTIERVRP